MKSYIKMFEAAGLLASSRGGPTSFLPPPVQVGLIPNIKLKFNGHLQDKIDKFNRIIGSIKE